MSERPPRPNPENESKEKPIDLAEVRRCREWMSTAEAVFLRMDSDFQKLLILLQEGAKDLEEQRQLADRLDQAVRKGYLELARVYRDHTHTRSEAWSAAMRRGI